MADGRTHTPPPPAPTHRRAALVVVVLAAAFTFTGLAVLVGLRWTPLSTADATVARALNPPVAAHPALVRLLTAVTDLGGTPVLVVLVSLVVLALLAGRRFALAAYLGLTTAGGLALESSLKLLVGRARPVVAHPVAVGQGNSFPSGHSFNSFVCYGALVVVVGLVFPGRARRIPTAVAAVVVVLVGLSRVALGVHFVTDVLGAWSLAIAWLGLCRYGFELRRRSAPVPVPVAGVEAGIGAGPAVLAYHDEEPPGI